MLVRTGARAKPAVIGEVEQPAGALPGSDHGWPAEISADVAIKPSLLVAARNRVAGKNDLVTDQRQEIRRSRRGLIAATVAGDESAAHLGELDETEPLEQILKRQVFAKRHEMDLIVDRKDRAAVADHVNRIVGARDDGAGRGVRRANRAGNQHLVRRQESRDLCKRIGFAHEEEWERRFRPDQNGYIAQAARLIRQREIAPHHLLLLRVVEFLVLLQIGLHDAKPHALDEARGGALQPHDPVDRQCRDRRRAQR